MSRLVWRCACPCEQIKKIEIFKKVKSVLGDEYRLLQKKTRVYEGIARLETVGPDTGDPKVRKARPLSISLAGRIAGELGCLSRTCDSNAAVALQDPVV